MIQRKSLGSTALILWALVILLACNLGTSGSVSEPPTLAPRPSATPPPTLGFTGNIEGQPGVEVASITTPVATRDAFLRNLINQVEIDRLMAHVDALQNFHTRHVLSNTQSPTQGIGAARTYIREQFELIGRQTGRLVTFPHEFILDYGGARTAQQNVVAVIQGTEPGAGTIVVGAHYDSVVMPSFTDGSSYAPGANDNGSGVAALLELARVLAQTQHRSSIMFVAFSAEETGRQGSIAFVQDYARKQGIDVFAMVNIDQVGNENDAQGRVSANDMRIFSNGPNDTSQDRHLARTAEFLSFTQGMDMKLIVEDAIDRTERFGDHFSFTDAGYPAIRFISTLEEKTNGDKTDTIEYIEPGYFKKATQSILMVIASLADGPRPPRNISLRPQDSGVYQLIWEPVPGAVGYVVALRWPGSLRYDQQIEINDIQVDWDGFGSYEGIAIAARGPDGIIGPLSVEYKVQR